MAKQPTKEEMQRYYEAQIKRLEKNANTYLDNWHEEKEKRKNLEQRLQSFERLDRIIACFAKQRVAKDAPLVQLGLDVVDADKPTEREVCRTYEQAVEQIFSDFDAAYDYQVEDLEQQVSDLEGDKERLLRLLGIDEFEWRRKYDWRY